MRFELLIDQLIRSCDAVMQVSCVSDHGIFWPRPRKRVFPCAHVVSPPMQDGLAALHAFDPDEQHVDLRLFHQKVGRAVCFQQVGVTGLAEPGAVLEICGPDSWGALRAELQPWIHEDGEHAEELGEALPFARSPGSADLLLLRRDGAVMQFDHDDQSLNYLWDDFRTLLQLVVCDPNRIISLLATECYVDEKGGLWTPEVLVNE